MPERNFQQEEMANALTHGLGAVASLLATLFLLRLALQTGDPVRFLGVGLYGFSLVLLYASSALYHAVRHQETKRRLRVLDHCAIYILIAGTYTPFALLSIRGAWGWFAFALVWTLALAGVVLKIFYIRRLQRFSTPLYLAMGWMGVLLLGPFLPSFPPGTLLWLLAGGIAYTVGTVFFHRRHVPFSHAIWHLFVLAGSACHFMAIFGGLLSST